MSLSERIATDITVIDVTQVRAATVASVNDDGVLSLKIAPGVVLRGDRAQLREWFGEGSLTLADDFFDDLEAEVNRRVRAEVAERTHELTARNIA